MGEDLAVNGYDTQWAEVSASALTTLLALTSDAVLVFDGSGVVSLANDVAGLLFGRPLDALMGKKVHTLFVESGYGVAGDAATLAACYLVASLPETDPDIDLAFSAIAFDAAGKLEFGVELRQHGALIDRALNGVLRLEHITELSGEAVDTVDLGSVVPVPLEKRRLSRPADGERHFFRLRISER